MAAVKEAAAKAVRSAFEPNLNGGRVERAESALRDAGFKTYGYDETKATLEMLGFIVVDSYFFEE